MLRSLRDILTVLALLAPLLPLQARGEAAFRSFLHALWPEAAALGVARPTFEAAIRGLEPDYSLPDLLHATRPAGAEPGQPEFVLTPAQYLRETHLARLAAQGKKLAVQHRVTLAGIERRFGVPPEIQLALWGRETAFGTYQPPHDAVRVLATQAYVGRRKDFFRQELLLVLKMLQDGIPRAHLRSSWGGAMGLTQLLPSEFYTHGVDFDRDGRVDIWTSVPDALASAANQLAAKGWQRGRPWFMEVRAPPEADCTQADPDRVWPLGRWRDAGYLPVQGGELAVDLLEQPASLLMPAGIYGPSFLIMKNYYVLKDYNFSDLYVLFVGHLAQRIAGGSGFRVPWQPVVQLQTRQVEEMQRRLATLGFYRDKVDGKAGMRTRLAVGAYQKSQGMKPDCWPSAALLGRLQTGPSK